MFILKPDAFADDDPKNLEEFVGCWRVFDNQTPNDQVTRKPIRYIDELNLDGDLSNQNVRRLLNGCGARP